MTMTEFKFDVHERHRVTHRKVFSNQINVLCVQLIYVNM